jgi:hypothetical protein
MEKFETADPVKPEQPMDQQDGELSGCIPLHVRTFFEEVHLEFATSL